MYEVTQTAAAKQPVTLEPSTALVTVAAPQLPAPLDLAAAPSALRFQQRFSDIIELRGKAPKPTNLIHRFFNGTPAWGVVGAAAAAAVSIPLFALGLDIALPFLVIGGGLGTFVPAFIGSVAYNEFATPFNALTRGKHLKEKDLAFLAGLEKASPTEQAVIGLLAERWMKRIDSQFVNGEAAFARIEDLANNGKKMPQDAQDTATAIVALQDAMVDHHGRPRKEFGSTAVSNLVEAFKNLPALEQRACAPLLMALYFKGEVVRVKIDKHEDARALYRALRDGARAE